MRILVIGAGALGGFFGACLTRAGRDVTFLVRPKRLEQLARTGLCVVSAEGDFTVPATTVLADDLDEHFDLILVGAKAYSLSEAMEQFAPAVGPTTTILPVLNGMAHIDSMTARFGAAAVLGGMAQIGASLDHAGRIIHVRSREFVFGEISGGFSHRTVALSAMFEGGGFVTRASDVMVQEMWEKWVQICTGAGMTCMMRGTIGDILTVPGGREVILQLLDECLATATAAGFRPRPKFTEFATTFFTTVGSSLKASPLRDIERGSVTEGDHILGEFAVRARALGIATPILDLARIHVATYEAGLAREAASS